jgi:hypothetical protein
MEWSTGALVMEWSTGRVIEWSMEGVTVTDEAVVDELAVDEELNDLAMTGGEKKPAVPEGWPPANSVLGE